MERISERQLMTDAVQAAIHRYRYMVAAQFATDADTVVDAACGVGYGREYFGGDWIGADKEPPPGALCVDLCTWDPAFPYDVWVGLETIEHLPMLDRYVEAAKRARRTIVISTPIVPTRHLNPWHLWDFTRESLEDLFLDDGEWKVDHYEEQIDPTDPTIVCGIWAFRR
jgi:hypothetical protein